MSMKISFTALIIVFGLMVVVSFAYMKSTDEIIYGVYGLFAGIGMWGLLIYLHMDKIEEKILRMVVKNDDDNNA